MDDDEHNEITVEEDKVEFEFEKYEKPEGKEPVESPVEYGSGDARPTSVAAGTKGVVSKTVSKAPPEKTIHVLFLSTVLF